MQGYSVSIDPILNVLSLLISPQVHTWIADKGNAFLSGSNTIGDNTAATQRLLKKHDVFESETEVRYKRLPPPSSSFFLPPPPFFPSLSYSSPSLLPPFSLPPFSSSPQKIYLLSNQLFSRAKELAASGECEQGRIEEESKTLEEAVHTFAARLDERREIILHSFEYYQKVDTVSNEWWLPWRLNIAGFCFC